MHNELKRATQITPTTIPVADTADFCRTIQPNVLVVSTRKKTNVPLDTITQHIEELIDEANLANTTRHTIASFSGRPADWKRLSGSLKQVLIKTYRKLKTEGGSGTVWDRFGLVSGRFGVDFRSV